jgi:predicted transcriptional regulator
MTKMTKREKFVLIANVLGEVGADEALVEAMDHEIELLDKRAGKGRGLTKAQKANENVKDDIVIILDAAEAGMTATDIANALGTSVQKVSQLMRQLVAADRVTRNEGKGKEKTTFTI